MSSLKDKFNSLTSPNAALVDRLQEILNALPQKLVQSAEKEMLLALVPIENPNGDRRTIFEMEDIKFGFKKTLAEFPDNLDCVISGYVSQYGNFMVVAVKKGEKNTLNLLKEKDSTVAGREDYFTQMQNLFPAQLMREQLEESELAWRGMGLLMALALKNVAPEKVLALPRQYTDGTPIESPLQGRLVYWDVNEGWEKPADKGPLPIPPWLRGRNP